MRFSESGLGEELTWDARQSASLEAKELEEQVIDELKMIFGKWIKIKSKGSRLPSNQARIRNN